MLTYTSPAVNIFLLGLWIKKKKIVHYIFSYIRYLVIVHKIPGVFLFLLLKSFFSSPLPCPGLVSVPTLFIKSPFIKIY